LPIVNVITEANLCHDGTPDGAMQMSFD